MNLNSALEQLYGADGRVLKRQAVGGGDINAAAVLSLGGGQKIFIKENSANLEAMFAAEALGLKALGEAAENSPPVPKVLAWGVDGRRAFLLLELIPAGRLKSGQEFGRALAMLHREARQNECGFSADNWIGSTQQKNDLAPNWLEFFRDKRLLFQWELARKNGFANPVSERLMQSLLRRLPDLLPAPDDGQPSLLHGDLWGGNWMAGPDGRAWLIDPAVYYGHREADIAMTQLFGRFPPGFHQGYADAWPLEKGFGERKDLYNLYHLLNHLNLFGRGYWFQVQHILDRFG
ncbi:MAG: hypothetical protein B0D92_04730 [Spirochaeta sp. LUC14_002_19_P3]|nr:MAG: hypothetical protein B0D92_04730 [Spirochaeta sp. LUC14_002_19_P3]